MFFNTFAVKAYWLPLDSGSYALRCIVIFYRVAPSTFHCSCFSTRCFFSDVGSCIVKLIRDLTFAWSPKTHLWYNAISSYIASVSKSHSLYDWVSQCYRNMYLYKYAIHVNTFQCIVCATFRCGGVADPLSNAHRRVHAYETITFEHLVCGGVLSRSINNWTAGSQHEINTNYKYKITHPKSFKRKSRR